MIPHPGRGYVDWGVMLEERECWDDGHEDDPDVSSGVFRKDLQSKGRSSLGLFSVFLGVHADMAFYL